MKTLRYFFEALLLALLMGVFKIMPLDMASGAGGRVGRMLGPRLAASRKALRNLQEAMPDLSKDEHIKILTGMWENLGRIMAEYPHLEQIARERVRFTDAELARRVLRDGGPCVLISGHLGSWEVAVQATLMQYGRQVDITYRAPNNPWADRLLAKARTLGGKLRCYPKSREGGYELIKAMREGRAVAILIDQKYNEGVAVPFFGRPAMTNPVFVQLARKFGYPIIPAQIERTGGAYYTVTLYDPLTTEGRETEDVIAQANALLEGWIRKRPEQWLWLHRRWDSRKLEDMKEAA